MRQTWNKAAEDALTGDIELAKLRNTMNAEKPKPDPTLVAKLVAAMGVLGLPATASIESIKAAYKQLMMKYHPDVTAGLSTETQFDAAEKAQRINEAYQTLRTALKF
jgi:DnaJ-domain-containing protein 1